ncbi:MAG: hypothetical protein K0Q55_3608, partial [Verrucomicrobia bacterium]|nr:hypothetical protein [Verrucomicrobiota bacterium]
MNCNREKIAAELSGDSTRLMAEPRLTLDLQGGAEGEPLRRAERGHMGKVSH